QELAAAAATGFEGPDARDWYDRVERELEEIRAALAWAERGRPERQLEIAADLRRFWLRRASWREGLRWMRAALDSAPAGRSIARARVLAFYAYYGHLREQRPEEAIAA